MNLRRTAVLLAGGLLALIAVPAAGHADFISMNPEPGSTVTALDVVQLTFSEDITALGSVVVVLDPAGESIESGLTVQGPNALVPVNPPTMTGTFYVNYRVVSVDSHVIEGSQQFVYDGPIANPTAAKAEPSEEAVSPEAKGMGLSMIGLGLILLITVGAILYAISVRKGRK